VSTLALPAVGGTRRETSLLRGRLAYGRSCGFCGRSRGWGESYVALAADHLVAVELGGESLERGLNDSTTETKDEVEGRLLQVEFTLAMWFLQIAHIGGRRCPFLPCNKSLISRVSTNLLDVVVGEGAAILELLAGKDQALLVWGNALLILDLGLHIVDGVRRLHLQGDGLACEGLDETV